jgi:hypothetical protein
MSRKKRRSWSRGAAKRSSTNRPGAKLGIESLERRDLLATLINTIEFWNQSQGLPDDLSTTFLGGASSDRQVYYEAELISDDQRPKYVDLQIQSGIKDNPGASAKVELFNNDRGPKRSQTFAASGGNIVLRIYHSGLDTDLGFTSVREGGDFVRVKLFAEDLANLEISHLGPRIEGNGDVKFFWDVDGPPGSRINYRGYVTTGLYWAKGPNRDDIINADSPIFIRADLSSTPFSPAEDEIVSVDWFKSHPKPAAATHLIAWRFPICESTRLTFLRRVKSRSIMSSRIHRIGFLPT